MKVITIRRKEDGHVIEWRMPYSLYEKMNIDGEVVDTREMEYPKEYMGDIRILEES